MNAPARNLPHLGHFSRLGHAGQVTTEIVLMLVISITIILSVYTAAHDNEWFANLVSAPWQTLASIIQNGVPGNVEQTASDHPNTVRRWNTVKGVNIQ